jgi:hypothetical protein
MSWLYNDNINHKSNSIKLKCAQILKVSWLCLIELTVYNINPSQCISIATLTHNKYTCTHGNPNNKIQLHYMCSGWDAHAVAHTTNVSPLMVADRPSENLKPSMQKPTECSCHPPMVSCTGTRLVACVVIYVIIYISKHLNNHTHMTEHKAPQLTNDCGSVACPSYFGWHWCVKVH